MDHAKAKAKEAAAAAALRERYELEASADGIEVVRRMRSHGPARCSPHDARCVGEIWRILKGIEGVEGSAENDLSWR